LAVAGVDFPVPGYLFLVAVADREQHRLGVVQVAARLAVIFEGTGLDDRVDRARLLAEAAEDALGEVDVVARRAPRAIGALLAFDMDGERRAHRLAQLARDAALLAVRIAAQRMQAAKTRALRRLLLGELHRDLAREQMPSREREPAQQLEQHEGPQEVDEAGHRFLAPLIRGVAPHSAKKKRLSSICSTASASRGQ